jgi:GntR family transcriptional regulator/MocR family aminotransferase
MVKRPPRPSPPAQKPVVAIEPGGPLPLYEQLYVGLRQQILEGRLRPGARLASTRDLAQHFDVSRFTVVQALERLSAEGYLTTRRGSGTYVGDTLPERSIAVSRDPARAGPPPGTQEGRVPGLSSRGRVLSTVVITGPRGDEPRPFHPRRSPLDIFPVAQWSRIMRRRWNDASYAQLDYGDPTGYPPLREAIAEHVSVTRGVSCGAHQVVVTSGSQQAFDILFRLALDPGQYAWMEEPGYLDVRAALLGAGARIVPVPVDDSGLNVEEALRRRPKARLAVVSPSHQYPTGVTLSAKRRVALVSWARETGAWIVEDDYDSYFRYSGRPMPALQSLDGPGPEPPGRAGRANVLYVGTFSKTMFPALRMGFCVVPERLIDAVANAKAIADRHSPIVEQAALAEFIALGHYDRHLRRLRVACQERYEAMQFHFRRRLGGGITLAKATAGTHVLGRLARSLAADDGLAELIRRAEQQGLVLFPYSRYCLASTDDDQLVLGFGGLAPEAIATGVDRLAGVLDQLTATRAGPRPRRRPDS